VLHHELAHIFGATIGDPVFGVSRSGLRINMGLIEGLATALAPRPADGLDLHDQAQALEALNRRPALASIMGPGFLTQSSRVAYTAAGSFCLWLIEHDGFEPMAVLYRTAGDFERAYDTSLDELEQQWLAFLRARERLRAVDVEAQAQRFERTSVWQRPCAHKVAAIVGEIGHANARVAVEEAVGHYRDLCALEPLSPSHKLGLAAGLGRATQFAEALAVLDEIEAMDALTTTVRAQVHERRGDVALQMGDFARASGAYAQAAESPASEDNLRVVQLKQLGATDPELAPIVVDYFAPFETADDAVVRAVARIHGATKIAGLPRHQALGRYLLGRQLLNVQRADDAIAPLEDSLRPGASVLPTPEFVRAAREALLSAYVEVGRYDDARALLRELRDQPDIGNGHRLEYGFWQERIDFFEAYRTPAG
jgi:pentatricopeptide repeat protein